MNIDDLFDDSTDSIVSMESNYIPYDVYFRRYGIRRIGQLSAPHLSNLSTLSLPRNSVLLYLPEHEGEMGINQNHLILKDLERNIYVEHHQELLEKEGLPRRTYIQGGKLIREYIRRNRKTKILKNLERTATDGKTLIIENFAMLDHLWRYRTHFLTQYNRWHNVIGTMWKTSNNVANRIDREQYVMVKIPQTLPSLSEFKRAENGITRLTLESFNNNDALFILDVWRWLGDNRSGSLINNVSTANLNKINLIFIESGVWTVMNLGLLNEWRATSKGDEEAVEEEHAGISGTGLQKYFLRFLTSLIEYRNNGVKTNSPVVNEILNDETEELETQPETAIVDTAPIEENKKLSLDAITNPSKNDGSLTNRFVEKQTERNKKIELVTKEPSKSTVDEIDIELDSLDHFFNEDDDRVHEIISSTVNQLPPLEKGIFAKANELAEDGLISAGQYRRILTTASRYKELPNPFGEGTLETLARVSPSDVAMPDVKQMPDDKNIFDKSMLFANIEEMDKKYNKVLLQKDIAAMVLNVQKANVNVTKYDVERIENVMNDYNIYSVRLTPVNGASTTIRFRLPTIKDDGSYTVNGIKCQLRKQRVDVPIRKVDDYKVALTSYYSKLFVIRSEKSINNYEKWLYNNIILKSHLENPVIKNLIFSNNWDNNFKTPRIYSILAKRFKSFDINDGKYFFDYQNRFDYFGDVSNYETEGRVVVGRHPDGFIVADASDDFILVTDKEEIRLGYITDILEIDETKSPIETVEMTVLNKSLPMGLVLSYLLGFDKLLKLMNAKPKRILASEKFKLEDDEFALRFIDESLIFNKRDKKIAMIFSGFLPYKDVIRNYSISVLNRKDIYFNLLDSQGIGLRYIREMDLLQDMWVDPVTEGLLNAMNEPTGFVDLLLRANELLLTDWSPDESDILYQRIRGYERFSGFVYQELVRGIRQYNTQSMRSNAVIEIHPEAVWRAIDKDVSKYLIQESNPIHNLKEKETITFSGTGGRSSESMVKRSRVYHKNDLGVISEATPDNKSVGVVAFLTPNPIFNSLRGTVKEVPLNEIKNSSLLSTSALISPCSDMDD